MAEKYIAMDDFSSSKSPRGRPSRTQNWRSKTKIIIIAAVAALVILALAIGLGVGLTIGRHHGGGDGSDDEDASALPTPAGYLTSNSSVWQPKPNSTWQIALENPLELSESSTSITPDVEVFDIDLFTNTNATITALHSLGKKVLCYFSAGSYEPDRPDSGDFLSSDMGKKLKGWPKERWLNISSTNVHNIMAARIELAAEKGCDGVDPDNMDGYGNDNGLGLTMNDTINYMDFLSQHAAQNNISIGLKNALAVVPNVINLIQYSVNEQCVEYDECTSLSPVIDADKAVFHIEYPDGAPGGVSSTDLTEICSGTGNANGTAGFSTVIKDMDLDGWVEYCNGTTFTTALNDS